MMPIKLDRRSRHDADRRPLVPTAFFDEDFPRLAAANGGLVAEAMRTLDARPLTIRVEDAAWTIARAGDAVVAHEGSAPDALVVALSPQHFSDWAQNQISFNGLMTARALHCAQDDVYQLSLWDSLWLTLLDGWPTVAPALSFLDRRGEPLDLMQSFAPDDDPADIAHFLREAGYLHLRGWLDRSDMAAICEDMDRAMPLYAEGDGKSWWATLEDGSRRCVRQQEFVAHSPTTARILSSARWRRLHATLAQGDPLILPPVEGRVIEALVKPLGVVAGPSDLPFHRDCHLGRHLYECSHLSIGIALTPTSRENGLLQVIAGSHRVAMPVEIAKTRPYLPLIELATGPGDLTVHLSCTLHASTAPRHAERRVMYAPMTLAGIERPGSEELGALRERVSDILRDEHEKAGAD